MSVNDRHHALNDFKPFTVGLSFVIQYVSISVKTTKLKYCQKVFDYNLSNLDIDECHEGTDVCSTLAHASCENTVGSYECECDDEGMARWVVVVTKMS